MADIPAPKPYFIDIGEKPESFDEIKDKIGPLFNNIDFMLSQLYRDLGILSGIVIAGNPGQVLTSNSAATNPSYQPVPVSGGTQTIFGMPTGGQDGEEGPIGPPGLTGPTGPQGPAGTGGGQTVFLPDIENVADLEPPPIPLALPVSVSLGGTGNPSLAANGVLVGEGTGAVNVTGPGSAGQVLTSNGAGNDPSFQAASGGGSAATKRIAYTFWEPGTTNREDVGWANGGFFNASVSDNTDAVTDYVKVAATVNSGGYMFGSTNRQWFDSRWPANKLVCLMKTGASITNLRIWIGLFSTNTLPGNTDTSTGNSVTFRYSTVAADPGWVGVVSQAAQTVSGNVANIATNTQYTLQITTNGSSATFSVNGGAGVTVSTNYPSATTWYLLAGVSSTDNVTSKDISFSRFYMESN